MTEKAGRVERIQRFEKTAVFELVNLKDLPPEEQAALHAAVEAQRNSVDEKWRVGVTAVGFDGTQVAVHNDGQQGHAEQRAVSALYRAQSGEKKLKIIALAGAQKDQPVIRHDTPYGPDVTLDEIEWMKPCAKCLEFIHDRTANVPDVKVLSMTVTGQVMRTSLRSLLTNPHTSIVVPVDHITSPSEQKRNEEK